MNMRPATLEDARLLLIWRNDPVTRANSFTNDEVAWDDHVAWLKRSLANDARRLLIAEVDGVPVGTVRFDRDGDAWEMSWTVAPEQRGQGVGGLMVRTATETVSGRLIAKVKPNNVFSRRIAERAGFQSTPEEFDGAVIYQRR